MSSGISLHLVIIMQHDLEKAIAFYQNIGLELLFQVPNKWAELDMEGAKLGLAKAEQELPERRTGIVFEVADVLGLYERLHKEGVEFAHAPIEEPHGIMASFKDPGNNIIDIYQPTPEKLRESLEKETSKESQ